MGRRLDHQPLLQLQQSDPGHLAYPTFIHEIGHAIGLKHPGNYNAEGGGTPGPYLPSAEDNHQYTVMSYYSGATTAARADLAAAL